MSASSYPAREVKLVSQTGIGFGLQRVDCDGLLLHLDGFGEPPEELKE